MMSFGDGYDVGGGIGGGFTAADGICAEQCVCTALDTGLSAIVDALTEIDNTLAERQQQNCEIISTCQSEIQALIDASFGPLAADVEAAQLELSYMLGTLTEQATQIADLEAAELADIYLDEEEVEPDRYPPPQVTYYGWCDVESGIARVTSDPTPPAPGAILVTQGFDDATIYQEAEDFCKTYEPTEPVSETPPDLPVYAMGELCGSIEIYATSEGRGSILVNGARLFSAAAGVEGLTALGALGFEGLNVGNIGEVLVSLFNQQTDKPALVLRKAMPSVAAIVSCNTETFIKGANILGSLDIVKHECGFDMREFAEPIIYAMRSECRNLYIEPKEAVDAYLSNAFDYSVYDTLCAIAGLCPDAARWNVTAAKAKPEIEQLIMMRHRELIDAGEYADAARNLGYLEADVPEDIFRISEHLPDLATAAKMLQQSATDDDEAGKLGLDRFGEQLTEGKLAEFIRGNGISDETAKLFWRAHWITPGLSTLVEVYHRLRDNDEFNANGEITTDITDAMDNLAIPKFWQERIMAVALSPLLKRDIRFAYTSGALSDDDIKPALRKTGHDDDAVDTIIAELKPARRHALLNHVAIRNWTRQQINGAACIDQLDTDGFDSDTIRQAMEDSESDFTSSSWSDAYVRGHLPKDNYVQLLTAWGVSDAGANALATKLSFKIVDNQTIRDYRSGTIGRGTAQGDLSANGLDQAVISKLLSDADAALSDQFARECIEGVRSQYVTGGIPNDEARNMLQGFGVDPSYVNDVVQAWDCKRKADGRDIAVEKLCHWLYIGAIDQADMYQRLLRLGYSETNASLLMVDCVNANTLKAVKQQQAQARELQRAVDADKRAIEKANAATQRKADRLARIRSEQARLRGLRQKQYLSASEKVFRKVSGDLSTVLAAVRSAIDHVKTSYALNEDEALKIAILAAEQMTGDTLASYGPLLAEMASAAASAEPTPVLADVGIAPSSNGSTTPSA